MRRTKPSIAMALIASVVVGFSLPLIFAPITSVGTAVWLVQTLCVVGNGFMVGGMYDCYQAFFNPEVTWADFGKVFCKGFIVGCVGSVFSLAANMLPFQLASLLGLEPHGVALISNGLCGLVTNSFANWMNSRPILDNCLLAILLGAGIEHVCFGLQHGFGSEAERRLIQSIGNIEVIKRRIAPWLKTNLVCTAKAVCGFRMLTERVDAIRCIGQDAIATFALWITLWAGKSGDPATEASATTSGKSRDPSPIDGSPPGEAAPPNLTLETNQDQNTFQRPLAAAAQSISFASSDSRSDGINLASATPPKNVKGLDRTSIKLSCLRRPQMPQKFVSEETHPEIIKRLIAETVQKRLPATAFDENSFIGSTQELIALYQEYNKVAKDVKQEITSNPNFIYATTGEMREGSGPQSSYSPQQQRHNKKCEDLATEKEKPSSKPEGKEKGRGRAFNFLSTNRSATAPNGKKIATVHKLIVADEDCNYKLTEASTEWPKFKGKMKVIGLMGAPRSGKTTLAQSIVFRLGYTISQAHATLVRISTGVHAYVLLEEELIIVECCEGIDPPAEIKGQTMSQSPYGALLLELFMYIFCMRIVYTIPFDSTMAEKLKAYTRSRLYMLTAGAAAHKAPRHQHVDFVLRVRQDKELYEKDVDALRNYLTGSQQSFYERAVSRVWGKSEANTEMESLQALNTITVNVLRLFGLDDGTNLRNEYENQLQAIVNIITSKSNDEYKNKYLMNGLPIDSKRFAESLTLMWEVLAGSPCLKQIIAELRAEEEVETGHDSFKEYFDKVDAFVIKLQKYGCSEVVKDYNNFIGKARQQEFEDLKNDEQNPAFFIVSVVKLASLILQHSIGSLKDSKLKEEGIGIALNGFALLVRAGNNTAVEVMALRTSFFECKLMTSLNRHDIRDFYPDCWFLLTRLARSGFRLPMLGFDLWNSAIVHLKRNSFNTEYEAKIYLQVLCLLEELTDPDPARCVPNMVRHADIFFSKDVPIELVAFDFEKRATVYNSDIIMKLLNDPSIAHSLYYEWLRFPKNWFDGSDYAKEKFDSDNERKYCVDKLLGTLMSRNFEILYRQIAETLSKEIVKRYDLFMTKNFDNSNSEIGKMRLLLWKNVAENSKQNKELFCSLLETNLPESLIEEYIQKDVISENFPEAHNTLCAIIGAENMHKEDQFVKDYIEKSCGPAKEGGSNNVHTVLEIEERDRRLELAKRWTLARLRCLECGVVEKLTKYFCENRHGKGIEFLLSALVTYFVNGHNEEEKQLSENIYMAKRLPLTERIAAEITYSAAKISNIMDAKEEVNEANYMYQNHLAVLKTGCQFINVILAVFYNEARDEEKFFCAARERQNYPEDRNEKSLQLHYLNFALNMASVSQRNVNEILLKNDITNIGTMEGSADPVQIAHTEEDFLNLGNHANHHKLIVVASDFLKSDKSLQTIKNELTTHIEQLQKEIAASNKAKKEYLNWIEKENKHREEKRRQATKETEVKVTSAPQYAPSSVEMKYAIEDVPFRSSHYDHQWDRKPSFVEIKQTLGEKIPEAFLDAYTLVLLNYVNEKSDHFSDLLRFLTELILPLKKGKRRPFTIGKGSKFIVKVRELEHFEVIFAKCGYLFKADNYVTNEQKLELNATYVSELHKHLNELKGNNVTLLPDSRSKKVEIASDLGNERLPPAFFNAADKDYSFHSTLSIKELLGRRSHRNRVPEQLRYSLVRVVHNGSGDCYQAVFTPEDAVSDVLEKLKSCGMSGLYQQEEGDLDKRLTGKLKDIGGIVIQLKGY